MKISDLSHVRTVRDMQQRPPMRPPFHSLPLNRLSHYPYAVPLPLTRSFHPLQRPRFLLHLSSDSLAPPLQKQGRRVVALHVFQMQHDISSCCHTKSQRSRC